MSNSEKVIATSGVAFGPSLCPVEAYISEDYARAVPAPAAHRHGEEGGDAAQDAPRGRSALRRESELRGGAGRGRLERPGYGFLASGSDQ